MQVTLEILLPHLNLTENDDPSTLAKRTTTQRLLCEALLPIIEAAYNDENGDGLPLKQSEELREASQKLLYSCPLVNLPTIIKLSATLD